MSRVPAAFAYCGVVLALLVATSPAWKLALMGNNPTLDQLLQIGCSDLSGGYRDSTAEK